MSKLVNITGWYQRLPGWKVGQKCSQRKTIRTGKWLYFRFWCDVRCHHYHVRLIVSSLGSTRKWHHQTVNGSSIFNLNLISLLYIPYLAPGWLALSLKSTVQSSPAVEIKFIAKITQLSRIVKFSIYSVLIFAYIAKLFLLVLMFGEIIINIKNAYFWLVYF